MRCIAIDDEPLALKLLAQHCEKIPSIKLLGAYTDPVDALAYIRTLKPDLIFLDIHMPDLSGIEIANVLGKNTMVIFTTAYKEYAVDGFELDVVDFLLKPFDFERFQKAYIKAEERFQSSNKPAKQGTDSDQLNKCIVVRHNYHSVNIPVCSILYIEASNNNIKIFTEKNVYTPVMTMKNIWDLLPKKRFIRVHKSYIVPIDKIKSYNREKVITETIHIPMGRAYYKDFIERIKK